MPSPNLQLTSTRVACSEYAQGQAHSGEHKQAGETYLWESHEIQQEKKSKVLNLGRVNPLQGYSLKRTWGSWWANPEPA